MNDAGTIMRFLVLDVSSSVLRFDDDVDFKNFRTKVLSLHWFSPDTQFTTYDLSNYTKVKEFISQRAIQSLNIMPHMVY
jgi:hypothetical protein